MEYYRYLDVNQAQLFTAICLPNANDKFPTIIIRSPYVDELENKSEEEVVSFIKKVNERWLNNGYAIVYQHCRGRGKSSGDCVPYINEREDGLALQDWVRKQHFYNGELFLTGGSYLSSVHFVTAPFANDIKGAILEVQDCERYNCNYRNGFYKIGLHGGWYVGMYKAKSIRNKDYTVEKFNMLPLINFSKIVFGEVAEDFDQILLHPNKDDQFWTTRYGGGEARNAIRHANIPILLITGFYDIYTGGIFDMWNNLEEKTKSQSALLVHPYGHDGDGSHQPIQFEKGNPFDEFNDYQVDWFNSIRNKKKTIIETGKVTYYKLFADKWNIDDFTQPLNKKIFILGEGEKTYQYNPQNPASFKGGLSTNFGGNAWQDKPNLRDDIITIYTPAFDKEVFVKGKMNVELTVKSNCLDTCFYVRLSLVKENGDYGLRDDINQISNFDDNYVPNNKIKMNFTFDEHAFIIHKGERIRIDITSSAFPLYVNHTNNKGLYCLQENVKIADNTVFLDESNITIYYE